VRSVSPDWINPEFHEIASDEIDACAHFERERPVPVVVVRESKQVGVTDLFKSSEVSRLATKFDRSD